MEPGGSPSLQNCAGGGDPGAGGFDTHAPSPPPPSSRPERRDLSFSAYHSRMIRIRLGTEYGIQVIPKGCDSELNTNLHDRALWFWGGMSQIAAYVRYKRF